MCSLNNSLKYLSNAHDYAIFIIRIEIKIAQNVRNEVVIIIYAGDEMMAVKDSRARAVAWLQQPGWEAGYLSSLQGYPVAHLSERRSRNLAPVAPPTHDTTFNSSYIFLTAERRQSVIIIISASSSSFFFLFHSLSLCYSSSTIFRILGSPSLWRTSRNYSILRAFILEQKRGLEC